MISAVKALPIESQPLSAGRPSAQIYLSLLVNMARASSAISRPPLPRAGAIILDETGSGGKAVRGAAHSAQRGLRFSRKAEMPSRASSASQASASWRIVSSITSASIRGPSERASRLARPTAPRGSAR